jgi:FlaA1/EpsC-like NDP-sugar epimerase
MKILITGALGGIGSMLCEHFQKNNVELFIISSFDERSRYFAILPDIAENPTKGISEIIRVVLIDRLVATLNRFSDKAKPTFLNGKYKIV